MSIPDPDQDPGTCNKAKTDKKIRQIKMSICNLRNGGSEGSPCCQYGKYHFVIAKNLSLKAA